MDQRRLPGGSLPARRHGVNLLRRGAPRAQLPRQRQRTEPGKRQLLRAPAPALGKEPAPVRGVPALTDEQLRYS